MASTFFTAIDIHCITIPNSLESKQKHPIPFTFSSTSPGIKLSLKKNLGVSCCKASKSPPKSSFPDITKETLEENQSFAEQLRPLSTRVLSGSPAKPQLSTKPKSVWVNPTKPRPSVLNLERQKRTIHSYGPLVKERFFVGKLKECESEAEFLEVLKEFPSPPTKESVLFMLNKLRPWRKTLLFFNWLKSLDSFRMETIYYNCTMKALRFDRQFQLVEDLANDMISNGIELDNITYSTIISCAKRARAFDKAIEWFERMYKTGLMPDEVTYSSALGVYAELGKTVEVISLYDRAKASGWKPDAFAFAVLAEMFGQTGDYDGIMYVLREMESVGVKPNLVLFNTVLEALGKAEKPGLARLIFEKMVAEDVAPDVKTLTALAKIYGRARRGSDALDLWKRMKSNGWPMDFKLYNTLLSMCADLGLEEEAETLFEEMKGSKISMPDSFTYTAMLNIYASGGKVENAMKLFDEMSQKNVAINVMGSTCLIHCLGKAMRIDDLVKVFELSINTGVQPDDILCGALLSVVSYCDGGEDLDKVVSCLQKSNPKLVSFIMLLEDEKNGFEKIDKEFKEILGNTEIASRKPFCNCFIDICRKRDLTNRAHELLYMGTMYNLYPGLHTKTSEEWRLNVRSLSVGAADTAFEEWMQTLIKMINRGETLPEVLSASTGAGKHKYAHGLVNAFESNVRKLSAPFWQSEENPGLFVATREDVVSWVQSQVPSLSVTS